MLIMILKLHEVNRVEIGIIEAKHDLLLLPIFPREWVKIAIFLSRNGGDTKPTLSLFP